MILNAIYSKFPDPPEAFTCSSPSLFKQEGWFVTTAYAPNGFNTVNVSVSSHPLLSRTTTVSNHDDKPVIVYGIVICWKTPPFILIE